jgi:2-polyprenyl-6-methoxyphenol hydroxylase-like FAD-dependent oxidoreductase
VRVRFARSGVRRAFDLVVGADGLQSQTRRMVWGADSEVEWVRPLDMFASFFSIPRDAATGTEWRRFFHAPGRRGIMLRPDGMGVRTTVLMAVIKEDDPRLVEAGTKGREGVEMQKSLLEGYFRDAGWESERII